MLNGKKLMAMATALVMLLMLCSVSAFAGEVAGTIAVSEVAVVNLYGDDNAENTDYTTTVKEIATTDKRDKVILFKFNVSDYRNISKAELNFPVYLAESGDFILEAYCISSDWKAGEITASQMNSIEAEAVTPDATNTYTLTASEWGTKSIDVSNCITGNGTISFLVRLKKSTLSDYSANQVNFSSSATYCITKKTLLNVTYTTANTTFSIAEGTSLLPTSNPIAIREDAVATNVYDTVCEENDGFFKLRIGTASGDDDNNPSNFGYVFVTYDLSDVDFSRLESVTLSLAGYWNNADGVNVYKVTSPWNSSDGSYAYDETVIGKAETYSGWYNTSLNILEFVKTFESADDKTVTLMLASADGGTNKPSSLEIKNNVPSIDITYGKEEVSSIAAITASGNLIAERKVVEGSADSKINAVPILALYKGGVLKNISIGDAAELDGTLKSLSASAAIDASDKNGLTAKFMIWKSLDSLVPVFDTAADELN